MVIKASLTKIGMEGGVELMTTSKFYCFTLILSTLKEHSPVLYAGSYAVAILIVLFLILFLGGVALHWPIVVHVRSQYMQGL